MTHVLHDKHSKPEPRKAPASVLVVDDDAVVLDALCAQIACDGFDVTACVSPSDALAALRAKPYAAIISDQNMPEMKGLEFLTLARDIQPMASRLLITGILSADTLVNAINQGEIYRFLSKPWTRAELMVCVRNAVQRHDLAEANNSLREEVEELRTNLATTQAELSSIRGLLPMTAGMRAIPEQSAELQQHQHHLADVEVLTPAAVHRLQEPAEPKLIKVVLSTYC